jgi:hypothetical protein
VSSPRPNRFRARVSLRLALMAVVGLVLSSCGDAEPGVAVRVGDELITLDQVDELTPEFCAAIEPSLSGGDAAQARSVYAMSELKAYVARQLASQSVADQIAAEYDVAPGETYQAAVAQQRDIAQSLPEKSRETYLKLSTMGAYVQDILSAAARAALVDEGLANPSQEEISARAGDLFSRWPDEHGLKVDPRLGFTDLQGNGAIDTSVSLPLSEDARLGDLPRWLAENSLLVEGDPDKITADEQALQVQDYEAHLRTLPDAQRCG